VTRWICFVRNWYSKKAPANSMIFEISFENQAVLARDSFETNFKRTQSHLALSRNKILDHHGVYSYVERRVRGVICSTICLAVKVYWLLANKISSQHWLIFNSLFNLFWFYECKKGSSGNRMPKIEHGQPTKTITAKSSKLISF
jgi:hypothetical protein